MKKLFLALIMSVSVTSVFALSYRHSIGVDLGSINGISYKGYVGKNLHFVIQADLYYQIGYNPSGILSLDGYAGVNQTILNYSDVTTIEKTMSQSVMASPSFMYQGKIGKWDSGTLNWYAGGSLAIGFSWGGEYDKISCVLNGSTDFSPWLKYGVYAIGGMEFCFDKAPLVLGLDLKPGFASSCFIKSPADNSIYTLSSLVFDWGANLTLRYCFGK